jgi:hypothetical protein
MKTITLWIRCDEDGNYFCYTPEFLAKESRTIPMHMVGEDEEGNPLPPVKDTFKLDSESNINRWFAHATPNSPAMKYTINLHSPFLRRHNMAIQSAIQEFDQATRQWKANQLRHDAVAVEMGVDSWDLHKLNPEFTPTEQGVNAMPDELANAVTYVVTAKLFGGVTDAAFLP